MATPDPGRLDLSDAEDEDIWASQSRTSSRSSTKSNSIAHNKPSHLAQHNGESRYDTEQAREAALQKELGGVRNINEVIEGVIASLERAKGNMDASCFT